MEFKRRRRRTKQPRRPSEGHQEQGEREQHEQTTCQTTNNSRFAGQQERVKVILARSEGKVTSSAPIADCRFAMSALRLVILLVVLFKFEPVASETSEIVSRLGRIELGARPEQTASRPGIASLSSASLSSSLVVATMKGADGERQAASSTNATSSFSRQPTTGSGIISPKEPKEHATTEHQKRRASGNGASVAAAAAASVINGTSQQLDDVVVAGRLEQDDKPKQNGTRSSGWNSRATGTAMTSLAATQPEPQPEPEPQPLNVRRVRTQRSTRASQWESVEFSNQPLASMALIHRAQALEDNARPPLGDSAQHNNQPTTIINTALEDSSGRKWANEESASPQPQSMPLDGSQLLLSSTTNESSSSSSSSSSSIIANASSTSSQQHQSTSSLHHHQQQQQTQDQTFQSRLMELKQKYKTNRAISDRAYNLLLVIYSLFILVGTISNSLICLTVSNCLFIPVHGRAGSSTVDGLRSTVVLHPSRSTISH